MNAYGCQDDHERELKTLGIHDGLERNTVDTIPIGYMRTGSQPPNRSRLLCTPYPSRKTFRSLTLKVIVDSVLSNAAITHSRFRCIKGRKIFAKLIIEVQSPTLTTISSSYALTVMDLPSRSHDKSASICRFGTELDPLVGGLAIASRNSQRAVHLPPSMLSVGGGRAWNVQFEIVEPIADFCVTSRQFVVQSGSEFGPCACLILRCHLSIPL